MNILIAGGTGYIGSHICVELLESGHDVVVIDDFSNSKPDVLESIYKITGKRVKFYEFNVLDEEKTESVFKENKLDAVIHCAAFKAVGESVQKPIEYYTNNLMTTLVVAKMMKKYHVPSIVFSSSATVYGDPEVVPAGSYAKEALTNLGVWDSIQDRLSLAGNVTEVLSQVETQNAEIGLVYATDAASSDKVEVVAECDNSLLATPVLYPVGRVSSTKHKDEANSLIEFLKSDKALKVFKKYGFKKGE